MVFRASLIQLWTRAIGYVKSKDYYENGDDNQYAESMQLVIMNSPIGSRVQRLLSKYISGQGVTNDEVIYDDIMLSDIVSSMGDDLSTQGGVWVHRSLKFEEDRFVTDKIEVLDYLKCRFGKPDDEGYGGKIWYGDFADKSFNAKKKTFFYPFSADQKVIKAQILADSKDKDGNIDMDEPIEAKIERYRGQVMYINSTPKFMYAISPFNSVFNDLDTDYRVSAYANEVFRDGFLGKTMVLFESQGEEEDETMKETIKGWLGVENTSNLFVAGVQDAENVANSVIIKKVETDYNDDMATNTMDRIKTNILGAGEVPEGLIYSKDNAIFAGSGEQYAQMKRFYSEQTEPYRRLIEKALFRLGYDSQIIEIDANTETDEVISE